MEKILMIDIDKAVATFKKYTSSFDKNDPMIELKYTHTFGVMKTSSYLCKIMKLNKEDTNLALLIALLHDIGRFEQAAKSHTFLDTEQMDHATYGCRLLFDEGHIHEYLNDRSFDKFIKFAIENHSRFAISPCDDERMKLHACLIRDADKLDNFRVKEVTAIETLLHVSQAQLDASLISKQIYTDFMNHKLIHLKDRITPIDFYISYLAFIYDLNFSASYQWIAEHNYLSRLINRLNPQNPVTKEQLSMIKAEGMLYIEKKLS